MTYRVVEVCAAAGGQPLGLELAGFEHELCVELDPTACATLRLNRPHWKVAQGDVANPEVWNPAEYAGVDLQAGGVPCPPFTVAGKQLGATDERDLFAWAIKLCATMRPRALLLENVRGRSLPRFAAYRQHVLGLHRRGRPSPARGLRPAEQDQLTPCSRRGRRAPRCRNGRVGWCVTCRRGR